jgi:hypothetical protein
MVQPEKTHNDIIRRTRVACWITKTTDTNSEYVIIIALSRATMVTHKAPHSYVLRTLPVLFQVLSVKLKSNKRTGSSLEAKHKDSNRQWNSKLWKKKKKNRSLKGCKDKVHVCEQRTGPNGACLLLGENVIKY